MMKIVLFAMAFLFDSSLVFSQEKFSPFVGKWAYEIEESVFGKFSGVLEVSLTDHGQIKGVVTNSYGQRFWVKIMRIQKRRIVFASNIEDSDATLFCDFSQGEFRGVIEIKGDSYLYQIKGKRDVP